MKYLIIFIATIGILNAQTKTVGPNGEGVNPANFRTAINAPNTADLTADGDSNPGKPLKTDAGGFLSTKGITAKNVANGASQTSLSPESLSGTDGTGTWGIFTQGFGDYYTPAGNGVLALTARADGKVDYNALQNIPTTFPTSLSSLTQSGATSGQIPTWNGTAWAAASPAITSGDISTNGGANKIAQFDSSAFLRTGAINGTGANPGGGLRIPAQQRLTWEQANGDAVANVWMFDTHGSSHDANYYPELVWSSARHCYYWDDGFQLGNSTSGPGQRGWRFLYLNPLGQACAAGTSLGGSLDTTMESPAVQFGGSWWNGSAPVISNASIQYVPDGVASGELGFWIGGSSQPGGTSSRGRILASSGHVKVFGLTPTGIKLPAGKRITFGDGTYMDTAAAGGNVPVNLGGTGTTTGSLIPTGDFTLTQNGVPVIQSDAAGALTNSIRVAQGKIRVGTSQNTAAPGFPFEVRLPGSGDSTAGEFYVDTNGTVRIGRLSATSANSSGNLIIQDRLGTSVASFNAVSSASSISTNTLSISSVSTFSNTTDSTSATTGSVKIAGGLGIAKKLSVGTGFNVSAPPIPASASASGTAGDISWDTNYIYICTAPNAWKRVAISSW